MKKRPHRRFFAVTMNAAPPERRQTTPSNPALYSSAEISRLEYTLTSPSLLNGINRFMTCLTGKGRH